MKCSEYSELDDATQLAVLRAILADQHSILGEGNDEIAKAIADPMCQFMPESTVRELLGGSPP